MECWCLNSAVDNALASHNLGQRSGWQTVTSSSHFVFSSSGKFQMHLPNYLKSPDHFITVALILNDIYINFSTEYVSQCLHCIRNSQHVRKVPEHDVAFWILLGISIGISNHFPRNKEDQYCN